jgi:peptidoglycan/xylan/chitin deacetylase (PgdA/CDA1 family)
MRLATRAGNRAPRTGRAALVAGAVVGAAATLAVAQAGPGITGLDRVRRLGFRRLAGQGDPGHVALTFDDGPDPASTPEFLEVLADHGVRATFFMLGSMVARSPGLAADVAAAGHEIGVHGYEHRYLTTRWPQAVRSDLTRATDEIGAATGVRPRFFRPPYGVLSGPALLAVRELGLTPVLWGAWGREWTPGSTAQSIVRNVESNLEGGVTVLLHDVQAPGVWQAVLAAVPPIIAECQRRGLAVGPVGEHGIPGVLSPGSRS